MLGRVLLDTNIIVALFSGEKVVSQRFGERDISVSSTVLGELYYGARKSAHTARNLARIDEFAASVKILDCDALTAQHYGQIKDRLRAKGRPIPENDIWIAAIALQFGLPLATRDDHFKEVEGLTLEAW
ncbi:MAG: type II toxin-antitoxin system VapC family toxin [Terriglobia bacterium]